MDSTVNNIDFEVAFPKVFANLIVRMQEVDDTCVQATQDISKQDLLLVEFVGEGDQVIMRDIAEFLQAPFSTATGIVDKLVQKEYLRRYYSEEDRRTVLVGLTKKGDDLKALFCRMKKEMSTMIGTILSDEEKDQLLNILLKIDSHFRAAKETEGTIS